MKFGLICFAILCASDCIANDVMVSGDAVGDLVVGRAPPPFEKGRVLLRRWQDDENGERYELLRVTIKGIPVDAEVYDGNVWRIWIDKPGLKTRDGLGVGDSAKKLLRNKSIIPEIGPGPSLVLISKKPCGISFITDAQLPNELPQNLDRKFALRMARDAQISKMILVGCDK